MRYNIFYHAVRNCAGSIQTAGIEITGENGKIIRKIYDVSTDFKALELFVKSLNESDISPEHIDSLIEDYYCEHY